MVWAGFAISACGGIGPREFCGGQKTGQMDKLRFYNIAQGSLEEWRYYLILTLAILSMEIQAY